MSQNINDINEDQELDTIDKKKIDHAEKYLTFVSDGLIFGVKASYVSEIITNHNITTLPMVPIYVKGIINLRGQIIPIIDIRYRMNKPAMEENTPGACIIVLNINNVMTGIFVDGVQQVTDIDETKINPPAANNRQELVNGIVSLPSGAVVLILDCSLLVNSES